VLDEVWGENLVEGVYIPRAPELFEEFAEAPDNSLVLFGHIEVSFRLSYVSGTRTLPFGRVG